MMVNTRGGFFFFFHTYMTIQVKFVVGLYHIYLTPSNGTLICDSTVENRNRQSKYKCKLDESTYSYLLKKIQYLPQ